MKHYFRTLWIAICGDEGFVYVRNTYLEGLEARIEKYERRAKGQRDANEKRKAKTPGFQIAGGNESF